jgi:uncharacterized protein with ACT and thioredoxin-like domain
MLELRVISVSAVFSIACIVICIVTLPVITASLTIFAITRTTTFVTMRSCTRFHNVIQFLCE